MGFDMDGIYIKTIKDFEKLINKDPSLKKLAKEYALDADPELHECFLNMQKHLIAALNAAPSEGLNTDAIEYADDYQELGKEIIMLYAEKIASDALNDAAETEADRRASMRDARLANSIQE